MCHSVNLFSKIAAFNVGYVFAYFLADKNIIFGYNFGVPYLNVNKVLNTPLSEDDVFYLVARMTST